MPIQHALWLVGSHPQPLTSGKLPSEQLLEDMIVQDPRILSNEWMLIGRQEIKHRPHLITLDRVDCFLFGRWGTIGVLSGSGPRPVNASGAVGVGHDVVGDGEQPGAKRPALTVRRQRR